MELINNVAVVAGKLLYTSARGYMAKKGSVVLLLELWEVMGIQAN